MTVNPAESTVARGNINVLVWPVFGGMFGWLSLTPGVNMQIRAETEEVFKQRVVDGLTQLWDLMDKDHEDDDDSLRRYRECLPHKVKPLKYIPVPCAPPYLQEDVLEALIERAYTESD